MIMIKKTRLMIVIIIIIAVVVQVVMGFAYFADKGLIENTKFHNHELYGLRIQYYDVDDYGNLYFPITNNYFNNYAISVYNNDGEYLRTLELNLKASKLSGIIGVYINQENNICVFGAKSNVVETYDFKTGEMINTKTITESEIARMSYYGTIYTDRERKGIRYSCVDDVIYKYNDGIVSVVFRRPMTHIIFKISIIIMIISIIALALSFFIAQVIRMHNKQLAKNINNKNK